jgi:hypothetical protein
MMVTSADRCLQATRKSEQRSGMGSYIEIDFVSEMGSEIGSRELIDCHLSPFFTKWSILQSETLLYTS